MSDATPVYEAKRWIEKAPGGSSLAQVFQLRDGRYVVVKFPENPQGERVLINEFLSCALAEFLHLPVNHAVLVSVDGRLLTDPQSKGECPPGYTAGIRCGMVRFSDAVTINEKQLLGSVLNPEDIHAIQAFDALVARGDGRQLLAYPDQLGTMSPKRFAAIDYGFAFGGSPVWTLDGFRALAAPILPITDPCTGNNYTDGKPLEPMISKLRALTEGHFAQVLTTMCAPRWGASQEEIAALPAILEQRRRSLVDQFDSRFKKQLEVFS